MKSIFETYSETDPIPLLEYLKNKKLAKYFNRETATAIVALGKLLQGNELHSETPFYYDTGLLEYEDYGLRDVVAASCGEDGRYSQRLFVEKGLSAISPLNQFKVLQNMPLSFVSIVYQLRGDNAVLYASAKALLTTALNSLWDGPFLIGAGKVHSNGVVEVGMALANKHEVQQFPWSIANGEAIEVFRAIGSTGGAP